MGSCFHHLSQAGRDQISDVLRIMGIAAFLFSFDIALGIGPVIAAVWVTYIAIRKGNTNGLLLHAIITWYFNRELFE